jgi:hypothetical protein
MARRRLTHIAAFLCGRSSAGRRALSAAAALPVLLLCALPLLCIAHCRLSGGHGGQQAAHSGHHGAALHGGQRGAAHAGDLAVAPCDHLQGVGEGLFIPAFWPGTPAAAAALLAGLALLIRLAARAPLLTLSPAGAPPLPPPR